MRLGHALRSLSGSVVVYLIVAACGSSDSALSAASDAGGVEDAIGAAVDALVDGVVSPEGEASAGPLPPDVATEQCNKAGSFGPTASVYAVHSYPGKTINDLSALRVIVHSSPSATKHTVDGNVYEHTASLPILRDGTAAVFCGTSGAVTADTVTFILPQ